MARMAVDDAAEQLGVSPRRVRQMLADGVLRGERIGHSWIIDTEAIEVVGARRPGVGRPWSRRSAWALLAVAGGAGDEAQPVERARAKRRLAEVGLVGLVGRLAARAVSRRYYAHPAVLEELGRDPGVVLGGVSAARSYGADILAIGMFEAYVRASVVGSLEERYALDADADRPNVILRVVADDDWPFAENARVAPAQVVAVDLLEAADERSRRAGVELAGRL
ncbi:MAG: helix-turn-helix domain-containing protein [Acidimicrobiales bacterium]